MYVHISHRSQFYTIRPHSKYFSLLKYKIKKNVKRKNPPQHTETVMGNTGMFLLYLVEREGGKFSDSESDRR